jgi:hypothetical protein
MFIESFFMLLARSRIAVTPYIMPIYVRWRRVRGKNDKLLISTKRQTFCSTPFFWGLAGPPPPSGTFLLKKEEEEAKAPWMVNAVYFSA